MMDASNHDDTNNNNNNNNNDTTTNFKRQTTTSTTSNTKQRPGRRQNKRAKRSVRSLPHLTSLMIHPLFLGLVGLIGIALMISFWLVLVHPERLEQLPSLASLPSQKQKEQQSQKTMVDPVGDVQDPADELPQGNAVGVEEEDGPHLTPRLPYLPIFADIPNGDTLAEDTLQGKPTIAGIAVILNRFTKALHELHLQQAQDKVGPEEMISNYFHLAQDSLSTFESTYRGQSIFDIRTDDSIYMSLAAFREHLLCQTLKSAFDEAKHPEKLYIGAIVQNCFGNDGRICRTGLQVVGKNEQGKDKVQQFDAPPDVNGIEEFCSDSNYKHYCDKGHIRALYIHDTDALGPAVARYYASKLWGGETYFLQMDSHLEFAPNWDVQYIQEVQATKSFPKAVLSAYPPGFQNFGQYNGGTPGARLCTCQFSANGVESHIIRINVGMHTDPEASRPTQIAFIAAGFFFAHASFLKDVPFDPYVPWCFMGEEIALSMRAWTAGWNIYAPRQNLIAHQYRPGRLGLPKFWESVGRESHRPNLNTRLQQHVIRRIKHMVGYPTDTQSAIEQEGDGIVLTEIQHYSMGQERSQEAYLNLTQIDVKNQQCHKMKWCNQGELE